MEVIRGENKEIKDLRAAPRLAYLHVFRLCPKTTAEDVSRYIGQLCTGVAVEMLASRHPEEYSSFKLVVPFQHLEVLKNPNVWPAGTNIKKFFLPRR